MPDTYDDDDSKHCGKAGCTCLHVYCDRGFVEHFPRKVPTLDKDGNVLRVAEYEQVTPCPGCKPEAHDARMRSRNRRDFGRRLRSLRPSRQQPSKEVDKE